MILKKNILFYGALLLCFPSMISASITTLQYWDPIPFFNAANLNMPPDTPFCYGVKERLVDEDANQRRRRFGLNISPFVQRAIRAQQDDGIYFGVYSNGDPLVSTTGVAGRQMSDFRGTAYLMGLFLGQDVNGNSIWGGPTSSDTGVVTDITDVNVAALTHLPAYLQQAILALNDNNDPVTPYQNAIIYNTPTNSANTAPSILSQSVLEQDQTYFGAFSVPLTYQKAGFRWEVNLDFCDDFGILARGGFCQIVQRAAPAQPLSAVAPTAPLELGSSSQADPSIYTGLSTVANAAASGSIPAAIAQATFNEWVQNNIDELLDPNYGANYDITTFTQAGIEDIQLLGFLRHAFLVHPEDPNRFYSMVITPYLVFGGTIPIAPVRDYSKLYSLPFGNNGHASISGVVGLTFDFIDSIEFGFEFGATGFLQQTIDQFPLPNHELQRVIYPYRENVYYSPGFNGQFAFILNAYEFTDNVSFSFRYNYVQHTQDTITMVTPSPYFFPTYFEDLTPWTSQMFIAALSFEIQPSIYVSIAWQGSFSQKNAYCSNTILGSLNFVF